MRGDRAEKFVVFNLRLLAASFAIVGLLFIIFQNGVLDVISDLGDEIGDFTRAPHTDEQFWLALGFAYMVVITGICVVVQADVVRYRPLLLVLAVGKTASSLATLGFYLFDSDVFIYLLNFFVDGYLALSALWLWSLAGRVTRPPPPAEGARRGSRPPSSARWRRSARRWRPATTGLPRAQRDVEVAGAGRAASSPRFRRATSPG